MEQKVPELGAEQVLKQENFALPSTTILAPLLTRSGSPVASTTRLIPIATPPTAKAVAQTGAVAAVNVVTNAVAAIPTPMERTVSTPVETQNSCFSKVTSEEFIPIRHIIFTQNHTRLVKKLVAPLAVTQAAGIGFGTPKAFPSPKSLTVTCSGTIVSLQAGRSNPSCYGKRHQIFIKVLPYNIIQYNPVSFPGGRLALYAHHAGI